MIGKLFKRLFSKKEEEKGEFTYAIIEPIDEVNEYAISEEYLYDSFYVIKYYKNGKLIGIEPYSKVREEQLRKVMPVIRKGIQIKTSKYIMESVIKFEM